MNCRGTVRFSGRWRNRELQRWQEIMISIPDAWEGKYQVEEYEEGFKLVQTVSYEKEDRKSVV